MDERVNHYLDKADEARKLSAQIARREERRSLTLLAAMWTALARHATLTGTDKAADGPRSS